MQQNFFHQMIQNLRKNEEVLLMSNVLLLPEKDINFVVEFLKAEYQNEGLNYPYQIPAFNDSAAIWSAKIIYFAAQFLLYRENKVEDLDDYLTEFTSEINAGAILTADLCLRFLPAILRELRLIDIEDPLIGKLESILTNWHYSAVSYKYEIGELNFELICKNPCLLQLYIDRVINFKRIKLAKNKFLIDGIGASLGAFQTEFWNEFKTSIE